MEDKTYDCDMRFRFKDYNLVAFVTSSRNKMQRIDSANENSSQTIKYGIFSRKMFEKQDQNVMR